MPITEQDILDALDAARSGDGVEIRGAYDLSKVADLLTHKATFVDWANLSEDEEEALNAPLNRSVEGLIEK